MISPGVCTEKLLNLTMQIPFVRDYKLQIYNLLGDFLLNNLVNQSLCCIMNGHSSIDVHLLTTTARRTLWDLAVNHSSNCANDNLMKKRPMHGDAIKWQVGNSEEMIKRYLMILLK